MKNTMVTWAAFVLSAVAILLGLKIYYTMPSSQDFKSYATKDSVIAIVNNATTGLTTTGYTDSKVNSGIAGLRTEIKNGYPEFKDVFGESLQNLRKRVISIDTTGESPDTTWEVIPVVDLIRGTGNIKLVPQVQGKWRLEPEVKPPAAATKRKTIF